MGRLQRSGVGRGSRQGTFVSQTEGALTRHGDRVRRRNVTQFGFVLHRDPGAQVIAIANRSHGAAAWFVMGAACSREYASW